MVGEYLPRSPAEPGRPPTTLALGFGSSGVALGVEYGTWRPGVNRVIDIAKVDCSGLVAPGGTFAGGTGMYDVMRWNLDCFWIECSGSGPFGVWIETACKLGEPVSQRPTQKFYMEHSPGPESKAWLSRWARSGATA
jgi:hypothetical protein